MRWKYRLYSVAGVALSLLIAAGCMRTSYTDNTGADEEKTYVDVYYDVTQCDDPWKVSGDDEKQIAAFEVYMANKDVDIMFPEVIGPPPGKMYCEACNCPNGEKIHTRVALEDLNYVKNEFGFYEEE